MTKLQGGLLALGAVTLAVGTLIVVNNQPTDADPPYEYCVDAAFYLRSCESSPYSVAAGTPGYAGQICGAHTYAWKGDDLFTYAILDQNFQIPYAGRTYPRPPASAGPALLAVYDNCYVNHIPIGGGGSGYPCTAPQPGGVQQYHPLTWAQLPPQMKTYYGNLFGCFGTPSPSPTFVPTVTPTGAPTPCATQKPCPTCVPTATKNPGRFTPTPKPIGFLQQAIEGMS